MIAKEKTKEMLDALIARETEKRIKIDQRIKNLVEMRDELEGEERLPMEENGSMIKEVEQFSKNVEYAGGNLSQIVRDILKAMPAGMDFDKHYVKKLIKDNRPDLYPGGRKARASFDAIFWKATKDLEKEGQIKANRVTGASPNTYKKLK